MPAELVSDPSDALLRGLLSTPATWAVVGLGNKPQRAAWGVSRYLQSLGMRIIPVHPTAVSVHGERVARTVTEAAEWAGHLDVVDCFVNSSLVGPVIDEAVAVGADTVWLQLGVRDDPAADRARTAGLTVVSNRCPAQEGPRLLTSAKDV